MNTGIFDQSKLRNWKAVNGRYSTGYKTIIDQTKDGDLLATWIDTGRPINGTTLLGFHPQLDEKEQLQIYLEPYRLTVNLKYDSNVENTNYSIFKYTIVEQGK